MTMFDRWSWGVQLAAALFLVPSMAAAQVQTGAQGGAAPSRKVAPKPTTQKPQPATPALEGKHWRAGPIPAWVVEPPPPGEARAQPSTGSRRDQLVDLQLDRTANSAAAFFRSRSVATDPSALAAVSQPQISYNPAYQRVVLHTAAVWRDGKRVERLRDARIEPLRREKGLEQQVIDGSETLLVVIPDVRVGEPVEIAWTVEGENPIYEGRLAETLGVGTDTPVDLLHVRMTVPPDRRLHVQPVGGHAVETERLTAGGRQVLRVVRRNVEGVASESAMPPWFKFYPAVQVSEYASWSEVDAWAQRLFAPQPVGVQVKARVEAFRATGLQGAALASAVLRFVQDDVRYFSVSLGESSHRPKPAEQTLAERLGDCKDKVVLLNALLTELGFDVRPALVSIARNRALLHYLPAHDAFDHVITRLRLDGETYWLDATIHGQGTTLASRGQHAYGAALVVGEGSALAAVPESPRVANRLDFEQRWDLSEPGQGLKLTMVMRAHGTRAEQWRSILAQAGEQRLAEAFGGMHTKVMPGLVAQGGLTVADDRQANVITFTHAYTHPNPGEYRMGTLEVEPSPMELYDFATGPSEAKRRAPWLLDQPSVVDSRITVVAPRAYNIRPQAPAPVTDKHLVLSARVDVSGPEIVLARRIERRADEVLPGDLAAYRENVLRMRQLLGGRVRVPLVDLESQLPALAAAEKRLMSARGARRDTLTQILMRNEATRLIDTQTLTRLPEASPLGARIRASRAVAHNLVGDFAAGLADADAALAVNPTLEDALDARGVALVGLGRMDDAAVAFRKLRDGSHRAQAAKWLGAIELQSGRAEAAEALLREAVHAGGGDDRDFALLWLYLAAERQGAGRGRQAVAGYLDQADTKKLAGAMLHFLDGRMDRDALVKLAKEKPDMERLNLAEAYFYIGQRYAVQGQRDEALRWYERVVETGALPYREVTFASLELRRGR